MALLALLVSAALLSCAAYACGGGDEPTSGGTQSDGANQSGDITGDGSSTVFPITEAVVEEFGKTHDTRVTVGISGTGGGFEKFCNSEIDFADASRPIKEAEKDACANDGIEYVEFQIAYDGISVVVNPSDTFVDCLKYEELRRMWEPSSTINNWSQVRSGFPNKPLKLYGPGTDSGTFDYFTAAIVGAEDASRSDYTASEDDNVLVQAVNGDEGALGYFGYAYYVENKDKLRLVGIDPGTGCVSPTPETILSGQYTPLSRPLYIYFNKEALKRPEVKEFVQFYLTAGVALVSQVGYVAATNDIYETGLAKLALFR
jgi:phosphate transport system substrate-binding protein